MKPTCRTGHPNQQSQVRQSTYTENPSKRSNYPSQIPVRVANSTCSQASFAQDSHVFPVEFPMQRYRDVGPPQTREDPIKSLEKAFNIYGERLRADVRDFRGLCTRIIAQEKQESAKWYALCAKVIMERDYARQKINILAYERNNHILNPASPPGLMARAQSTDTPASRASKRLHNSVSDDEIQEATSPPSSSNSLEARPIRPLRHSPSHSPATSPTRLSLSPSPTTTVASPPLSAPSTPPTSMFLGSSVVPESNLASIDQRPVKRRKSYDYQTLREITLADPIKSEILPRSSSPTISPKVKQQPRTPSPLPHRIQPQVSTSNFTAEFLPVDLMYVSSQGSLICRACL